jgi:hypothetical protein
MVMYHHLLSALLQSGWCTMEVVTPCLSSALLWSGWYEGSSILIAAVCGVMVVLVGVTLVILSTAARHFVCGEGDLATFIVSTLVRWIFCHPF